MEDLNGFNRFLRLCYDALTAEVHNGKYWVAESFLVPETHQKMPNQAGYDRHGLTFYETWSKGGTWCNYLGNEGTINAEDEPEFPVAFDVIMEAVVPDCSFMKYKLILAEVKERGDEYHGDYYGGSTTEGYKGFNIQTLYQRLRAHKVIE